MPMKHQTPTYRPRRIYVFALLLALLLPLLTAACTPGAEESAGISSPGVTSSESSSSADSSGGTEPSPGEPSSEEPSLPEESSRPEVSVLPEESEPENPSEPPSQEVFGDAFCYVAIGDSICRGYGLDDPETQRYSSLIGKQTGCTVYNYGVDGQTGEELITFLREGKAEALSQADVVSVSIGGNNLLHVLSTLFFSMLGNLDLNNPASLLQMDAEDLFAAVDDAVTAFELELPVLIELIGQQAPNAKILFQTVYNPYRSFVFPPLRLNGGPNGGLTTISALTDECIQRLNEKIRDGALQYGYTVCDVYDAFEQNADRLVNATLTKLNFDPHPNAEGHAVIAEVLLKEIPKKN